MVSKGISLCGDGSVTLNGLLKTLTDHGDTMIKVLEKCDDAKTLQDYLRIFERFGKNADKIINDCLVKEFIGLDEALSLRKDEVDAICFATSKTSDAICAVAVNGVYKYNPTISVPDRLLPELDSLRAEYNKLITKIRAEGVVSEKKILGDPRVIELGKKFTKFYNDLLTEKYATEYISNPKVAKEYAELINAITNSRKPWGTKVPTQNWTGLADDYSFFGNHSVINCAEIWAAREMILRGCKFEDLLIPTKHFSSGSTFDPCKNCKETFKSILH